MRGPVSLSIDTFLTCISSTSPGKNPNWGILNDNILRNTSAATLGKRDLSVQDNNGRWNAGEQILIMQPRILMVASNANDRSHYAHTVETVCTIVAAGGVDQDDARAASYYEVAAAAGVPEAQSNLGLFYAQGRGVAKNPEAAATSALFREI